MAKFSPELRYLKKTCSHKFCHNVSKVLGDNYHKFLFSSHNNGSFFFDQFFGNKIEKYFLSFNTWHLIIKPMVIDLDDVEALPLIDHSL